MLSPVDCLLTSLALVGLLSSCGHGGGGASDAGSGGGSGDAGLDAQVGACVADLPCASPSGASGDEICISGRVVEGADLSRDVASSVTSAIEVRLYEPLALVADSATAAFQTLTTANGGLDTCGRFTARFSVSNNAPNGSVAVVVTDRTGAGANDYTLTAYPRSVAPGVNIRNARAILVSHAQDQAWSAAAGLVSGTFASAGAVIARFHEAGSAFDAFPGTPIRGVLAGWSGTIDTSSDFYFTDSIPTSLLSVSSTQVSTGPNGIALLRGSFGLGNVKANLGCTTSTGGSGTLTIPGASLAMATPGVLGFADVEAMCLPNPTVTFATLTTQGAGFLADPRAIGFSPKDGALYVADAEPTGSCSPSCIMRVDATTGAVDALPVVVGAGIIEGIAFDATGDNLFYTDRPFRVQRLAWTGTGYANSVACDDVVASTLAPYHLVADPTLGILVADDESLRVVQLSTCAAATVPSAFSASTLMQPRGLTTDGSGQLLVSTLGDAAIHTVDPTTGAVGPYPHTLLVQPLGIAWDSGTSFWANGLLVADRGASAVFSVTTDGTRLVATLASPPVDLAIGGGHLYVLAAPAGAEPGRIYVASGF